MAFRIDGFSRVRVALDISEKTGILSDQLSGTAARFARGSRVRFEFALFHGADLADPSEIAAARLRVLSSNDPDSAIGIDKTIDPTAINAGITLAQWDAGEAEHCHLAFELTSSETAEGVFNGTLADADVKHWFLLTYGAGDDFLFAGEVESFDAGYTASGTPPLSGTAASIEQVRQIVEALTANVVRFDGNPAGARVSLTSPSGQKYARLGCDDAGNFDTGTQPTD